ncbi:MAG: hypothetical protein NVS2B16_02460 [Chloroflexota bacterium]
MTRVGARLAGRCLPVALALALLCPGTTVAQRENVTTPQLFVMPQAHASPVLHLIRGATRSIRLEIYLLTNRAVVSELQRARRRGVDVRVLLEQRPFNGARYAHLGYSLLHDSGIPVRWANESAFTFTHEKALTVDDRIAGIFTFNLTSSGLYRDRDFGVVDTDSNDARALAAVFDADWSRRPAPYGQRSHLVISPYNSRRTLTTMIDGAKRTLDLYAEEVNDSSIEAHLVRAAGHGVRVRLITSQASAGIETLKQSGVSVKIVTRPYIHAKAIVADGTSLFIGSENLSGTSLDRNREIGIVMRDSTSITVVQKAFSGDWQGGRDTTRRLPAATPVVGGQTGLRVSVSPATLRRGGRVTVSARTSAGAECAIRVTYPDGYQSRARVLTASRIVPASGELQWSWHVGSRATGRTDVRVSCTLGGSNLSGNTSFTIE